MKEANRNASLLGVLGASLTGSGLALFPVSSKIFLNNGSLYSLIFILVGMTSLIGYGYYASEYKKYKEML